MAQREKKRIVGLDIGSTKVSTLIALAGDTGLEPIGLGVAESKGLKRGVVVHLDATVESIKKSVAAAEAMAGCDVEQVYVGLSGPHIKSFNSSGATAVPPTVREIGAADIGRATEIARAVALAPDRVIVHILPQEFTVDDQNGITDPLGMRGARLEVNTHIVTSSRTAAENIVTAVNRSGLLVGDTVLDPIAAGEAVLGDDERELGVVLVDIGGSTTSVAVYHRGAIRHSVVLPLGSEHFTNDIAVGLRTGLPEAERIKREHGCAVSSMGSPDNVFEVAGVGSRQPRPIGEQVLADILQPRAEEIMFLVRNELRSAGYERQAGAGAVLTGGGALLRGLPELAEHILDLPVRLGTNPAFIRESRISELHGPEFATVAGLVLYGERRNKLRDFREQTETGFKKLVAKLRTFI
ncbi:MAG TPA: cell division protein FtsA [Terriglobia bacterium]|nr:cell division protein FtsA [Terriglobia bacterium]